MSRPRAADEPRGHSYCVAPKFGLTPHQHYALRAIGGYSEHAVCHALARDVSVVTLRRLSARGLIRRRGSDPIPVVTLEPGTTRKIVTYRERIPPGTTWREFELTSGGRDLADEVGPWTP